MSFSENVRTSEVGDGQRGAAVREGESHVGRQFQEKPRELQDREQQQFELRKRGASPSSIHLPKVDLSRDAAGKLNVTVGGTPVSLDAGGLKVDRDQSKSYAEARLADLQARSQAAGDDGRGNLKATPGLPSPAEASIEAAKIHQTQQQVVDEMVQGVKDWFVDLNEDWDAVDRLERNTVVAAAHQKLEALAEKRFIDPAQRRAFIADMEDFEERTAERENELRRRFEASGLTGDAAAEAAAAEVQRQIVETYRNMERLLSADGKAPVPEQDRIVLARQAMQHAADPYSIAQGSYDTCTVATIETRTFTSDPAAATRLIADVAVTGKYTTSGKPPVTVTLDAESLEKHGESNELAKREYGHRDYASQLFEVTAANIGLAKRNARENRELRYEQHEPVPGKTPPDSGERVFDYSRKDPATGKAPLEMKDAATGEPVRSPDISAAWQVAEISNEISPRSGSPVATEMRRAVDIQRELIRIGIEIANIGDGKPVELNTPQDFRRVRDLLKRHPEVDETQRRNIEASLKTLETVLGPEQQNRQPEAQNADELRALIVKAKAEGNLPLIVFVHSANEPFWTDSGAGSAGGSGGRHVITVTDYGAVTGLVDIQNQWGDDSNRRIGVYDLFRAMRLPGDNVAVLGEARKAGRVDYVKEFDLLRLHYRDGKIPDQLFDAKLALLAIQNLQRFAANGMIQDREWTTSQRQFNNLLAAIDPARAAAIMKQYRQVARALRKDP